VALGEYVNYFGKGLNSKSVTVLVRYRCNNFHPFILYFPVVSCQVRIDVLTVV
jgi:hypothetical protein